MTSTMQDWLAVAHDIWFVAKFPLMAGTWMWLGIHVGKEGWVGLLDPILVLVPLAIALTWAVGG